MDRVFTPADRAELAAFLAGQPPSRPAPRLASTGDPLLDDRAAAVQAQALQFALGAVEADEAILDAMWGEAWDNPALSALYGYEYGQVQAHAKYQRELDCLRRQLYGLPVTERIDFERN